MKQISSIWLVLIGSFIGLIFWPTWAHTQTSENQIDDEEHEVSSVTLEHFSAAFLDKPRLIVISDVTGADDRLQAAVDRILHPEPEKRKAKDSTLRRQWIR